MIAVDLFPFNRETEALTKMWLVKFKRLRSFHYAIENSPRKSENFYSPPSAHIPEIARARGSSQQISQES